jgi:predicted flap endonuclease-1-like 5' DNA nuclease
MQYQLNIWRSLGKSIMKPPAGNPVGQVVSLLSVLGAASRKKSITPQKESFKPIAIIIPQEAPPVNTVKGIGKKYSAKLKAFGILTVEHLRVFNVEDSKLVGISPKLIQKWQNNIKS